MKLPHAGERTGVFGEWLTKYLKGIAKYQDYVVYYDHGDPTVHLNVMAIKGIYGEIVSRRNQLAQVDVLVTKPSHEALCVVEIEERFSSPKKIIGDAFALLMCNQFSVKLQGKHQYFRITPETKLVIAGNIVMRGSKLEQLEKIILPRMKDFDVPKGAIDAKNVSFVFKETIEDTIKELEEMFMAWFQ